MNKLYFASNRPVHPITWGVHGWSSCQGSGRAPGTLQSSSSFSSLRGWAPPAPFLGLLLPLWYFCSICRKISIFILPSLCFSFLLGTRSGRWGCSTTMDWPHWEGGAFSPRGAIFPYYLCAPLVFLTKRALNAFTISWVISCSTNEAYNCVFLTAPH